MLTGLSGRAGRLKLPEFIADLGRPPGAAAALAAACLALFAVGLDPKVFSAGMPDAQAALRARPEIESLFLLASLVEAAFLLVGGVLGDTLGRRRVLLFGLLMLAAAEAGAIVVPEGPALIAFRITAAAAAGLILPVALAVVATTYSGPVRATALGVAYASLGASSALAPALLIAVTPGIGRWVSFLFALVFLLIAAFVVRQRVVVAPPSELRARDIFPHALWAFGLLSVTGGVIGFRSNSESLIRIGLIVGGIAFVALFFVVQRRRRMAEEHRIDIRPTTVALFAGVMIAIAQTAPLLEIPLFFQISQRYAPLLATIGLAPFIIALIVSGPVAGGLLTRFSPRALIAGGLAIVGIGDVLLAQISPATTYFFFIVPFFAVGAGFVVGTCVRTAVIFASTPRRMPATAAALNQTSLVVGTQAGVAGVTALVGAAAVAAFTASVPAGVDPTAATDGFRNFLQAIGTAEFGQIVSDLSTTATAQYGAAFAAGVQSAMLFVGIATLVSAAICWFAMTAGPNPVNSIWELREERDSPPPTLAAEPVSA